MRVSKPLYKRLRAISERRKIPVSDMARAYFVWLVGKETSSEMPTQRVTVRDEESITRMRGHFEEE